MQKCARFAHNALLFTSLPIARQDGGPATPPLVRGQSLEDTAWLHRILNRPGRLLDFVIFLKRRVWV